MKEITDNAVTFSFRRGDALVYHPLLAHRTQPTRSVRVSWYARFVESNATFCYKEYMNRASKSQSDCQHDLQPGQLAHHVCYQQMFPLLASEVRARMDPSWDVPVARMSVALIDKYDQERSVGLHKRECVE